MKKIIATIAIIISFAILANSEVSANTLEANVNNGLLTKQDVIQILDANQMVIANIDLAPITLSVLFTKTEMKIAKTKSKRQTSSNKQINSDD